MTSKDVSLYYFPSSYYSLKALLALFEKGVPFKHQIVNISAGEQNTDEYLTKNPNGEVPVLELDGEYISESEIIIEILDNKFTSGPRLVPDLDTSLGQEVRAFRQMLDDVPVSTMTWGVLANRRLCMEQVRLPSGMQLSRESIEVNLDRVYKALSEQMKTCRPEIRPSIERKMQLNRNKLETVMNEYEVSRCLEELEQVFDKIEQQLMKSKRDNSGDHEIWLFGSSFTAADITATVLMYRLTLLGVGPRYFSTTTREAVYEYYNRLMSRPSVRKVVDISNNTQQILATRKKQSYGKMALKAGFVVGLLVVGYFGWREFSKMKRGLSKA